MAGVGALGVILGHVASGHAAAGRNSGLMIGLQWAHFAAVGLWIGGLLALLVGLRSRSGQSAADAVRRFSTGAGIALAVVAITGLGGPSVKWEVGARYREAHMAASSW